MGTPWFEGNMCDFVRTDPEYMKKCPDIAADISAGRIQLVKLVESLGDLLSNSDSSLRALGTQVLSQTLKALRPDFLSTDELKFLGNFYCDRLKDHHEVLPAVFVGILAICNMEKIPKNVPSLLLSTMLLNVNCQSQRQTDRYVIYQILQCLISTHLNDIKGMGPDLVFGIISAMDGERDPRNLLLLFSILPNILRSLPLGHLTEEFFEVVACYFPVDFKPSGDDPGSVTREDLAMHLASCLTAIPQFAEFCLPLLLEKLDSALLVAKLDSLFLLNQACKVFSSTDLAVHLSPLWMSLSREALTNGQSEVREASHSAVSSLLRNFAASPVGCSQQTNPMQQLLSYIITATISALHEVQTNIFFPSSHLLLAASQSCQSACETVIKKVAPMLCQHFHEKPTVSEKITLLQTLSMFLANSLVMKVTPQDDSDIQNVWNTIVPMYLNTIQHNDSLLQKEAFLGLTPLVATLSFEDRQSLYYLICSAVDSGANDDVRDAYENCLIHIASLYPDEILQNILSDKLAVSGISFKTNPEVFKHRLSALCKLATLESFSMLVIPSVVDMSITSCDPDLAIACVSSLRKLLGSSLEVPEKNRFIYDCLNKKCQTVSRLVKWWMSNLHCSNPSNICSNKVLLMDTSGLVRDIMRNLNSCDQSLLLAECVPQHFPFVEKSHSFDYNSPTHITQTVLLLEAIIGPLHTSVFIPSLCNLCSFLVGLAIQGCDTSSHLSACRLLATLVNKISEDILEQILPSIYSELDFALDGSSKMQAMQATSLLGWMTKGLLMRGFKDVQYCIDKLMDVLGNDTKDLAMSAAEAFHIIMDESPEYLSSKTHCTIKLLYRQRFFQCSLELLVKYRKTSVSDKSCYLLALAHLLRGVPPTVLTNDIGEVLPLLLESLALESTVLLLASLDTIGMLLKNSMHRNHLITDIQSMVPRLLHLSSYKPSLKVRIASLECLTMVASFPVELLLPLKYEVVTHLSRCLDDPKRLVRKEAVKARTCWILLDAPGTRRK